MSLKSFFTTPRHFGRTSFRRRTRRFNRPITVERYSNGKLVSKKTIYLKGGK